MASTIAGEHAPRRYRGALRRRRVHYSVPETLLEDTQRSCERIRTQVEHYAWHKIDHNLHVTVSLGVAHNLGHARPEDQIREADARLYVAKQSGKNRVIAN